MDYQAIVIGGGHSGIEAALALSRLEATTLLITQNLDCIGKMSCNPAVGGLAKGNVVREIDALGGEMGKLIDSSMIQFRMLNRSKGPAVQAPRAQADKARYSILAKHTLEQQPNLSIFQDTVIDILTDSDGIRAAGVLTERGHRITCNVIVLTTGTFMEGTIFIGEYSTSSGRIGEPAAVGLGNALRAKGFEVGRLKTGTPARVLRGSLDFEKMTEQAGEEPMLPFSFAYDRITRPSVPCHITYTNERTHRIIRENIHRSPLYGGKIKGIGPRYCPSIEDKVMKFPDRERHQVFVEPEGIDTEEMYLNGISSSLPEEVQEQFLRTVPGLEHLVIMKPGYAVEYDYLNPTQLLPSLETKRIEGLFIAGQTNGTSGYEEAAAQGIVAGINASCRLRGMEPLVLARSEAYIGVLIDDLVTLGTEEPYRLFTSRAEHRLILRHETADKRLLQKSYEKGLQTKDALDRLNSKLVKIELVMELLRKRKVKGSDVTMLPSLERFAGKSLEYALNDPGISIAELATIEPGLLATEKTLLEQTEIDIKYKGYIKRQEDQILRFRKMEKMTIPQGFDYDSMTGISTEAKEKLKKIRPISVGQATRISGIRFPDISILLLYLRRPGRRDERIENKDE
jgi:tRNA uridine 5-carboxymethylaminomethyl modification enzyme